MKNVSIGTKGIIGAVVLAGACLAGSFLVALRLMGDIYFAEWLTASCVAVLVLVAWLSYLRDDHLMKQKQEVPPANEGSGNTDSSGPARRVLLLAALLLGLASIAMYFFFGIGATLKA